MDGSLVEGDLDLLPPLPFPLPWLLGLPEGSTGAPGLPLGAGALGFPVLPSFGVGAGAVGFGAGVEGLPRLV